MTYGDDRSASPAEYASEKRVIDRRATTEAGTELPCTCTYNGSPYPCPSHGMFNRLPSPHLLARLEYEAKVKQERERLAVERTRLALRAEDV